MFAVLEQPTRQLLNNINTFDKKGNLFCKEEDMILINEIKYNPAQSLFL